MTNEEMHTALYEKMSAEQDNYRAWLLTQPPEEILNHTYEYTAREDIVMLLEEAEFSEKQVAALLRNSTTLADLFKSFSKVETSYMDTLRDTVENKANDILRAENELRIAPVYPYPRDYAVENGELDKYRASRKSSIACKKAIEQAISEHYADNCLDTAAAVKQVVDDFGYDRTLYVLAVTVQHKDWDGRISRDNKDWAASVPVFEDRIDGSADHNVYLVVDKAHPGLVDMFVKEARQAQAREVSKERQPENKTTEVNSDKPSILQKLKNPPKRTAPNNSAKFQEPEL